MILNGVCRKSAAVKKKLTQNYDFQYNTGNITALINLKEQFWFLFFTIQVSLSFVLGLF